MEIPQVNLTVKTAISPEDLAKFNQFVSAHSLGNIHQISDWGNFQVESGAREKYWAVMVEDARNEQEKSDLLLKNSGEVVASAMIIKQRLPGGRCWLYVPRGPVWDYGGARAKIYLAALLEKIRELAVAEKAVFLRIDPGLAVGQDNLLKDFGFRKAHAHYQPENTILLDLTLSEAELLAQMKPKGRYNIKLAEKKGVKIIEIDAEKSTKSWNIDKGVSAFYKLLSETTSRDNFAGHQEEYYEKMLVILGADRCKLYLAEYEGVIIAGLIVTFFKDTAIYYFGASGNQHRNVMAPYLLQWQAIREARKRGLKFYDFLGVAPLNAGKDHAWAGVTEFKEKFGGKRIDFLPAQEKIYSWLFFNLIRIAKFLRNLF